MFLVSLDRTVERVVVFKGGPEASTRTQHARVCVKSARGELHGLAGLRMCLS